MNENFNEQILEELKSLNSNLKELSFYLKEFIKPKVVKPKTVKQKPVPLTDEEIKLLQSQFTSLYELWLSNKNQELQNIFDKLSPDETRRLADANNLNVTTRMAKEKVLKLIEIRFREKKMLLSNTTISKPIDNKVATPENSG